MENNFEKQAKNAEELKEDIARLVNASHVHGPFFLGPSLSYVDIHLAPWVIRLSRVLKPYRGWAEPEVGSRWGRWVQAIEQNEHVIATTSSPELYLDSYIKYIGKLTRPGLNKSSLLTELNSERRTNTSLVANAILTGRPLP